MNDVLYNYVFINQQIIFHFNSMCINAKHDYDAENTHTNNTNDSLHTLEIDCSSIIFFSFCCTRTSL